MIYLVSPCYRSGEPECLSGFERTAASLALTGELANDVPCWDREPRDSNQARARNLLFHRARRSARADFVVTADPDQLVEPDAIRTLADAARSGRDVVAPMILRKNINPSPVGQPDARIDEDGRLVLSQEGPFLKMRRIGFGVVCFARSVLDRMAEDCLARGESFLCDVEGHPNHGERVAAIVQQPIVDGRYLPVDDFFSRRWTSLGGSLWNHGDVIVGHVGPHVFR